MAHIVVLGAGTGGMPCAYELREMLGKEHEVTLINEKPEFQFTLSNPWVAVGWRDRSSVTFDIRPHVERKGISFIAKRCDKIDADNNTLTLDGDEEVKYNYLIIATGPRLAFEEVEGAGPGGGHTQSICTVDHVLSAYDAYKDLLDDPGHVIIGAMPFASCFGPAYEFSFIMDFDLRKRKVRDQIPMTYVTSEPYIGHLGLGGVGDSKGFLESDMRSHHINWITNAKVTKVEAGKMFIEQYDDSGHMIKEHELDFKYSMMLPAFKGVDAVASVEGLCNPRGFVFVDSHQRNPTHPNIYSAGVCIAIPPVEATAVPTGAPKTGYMIESMVAAIVHNIDDELSGRQLSTNATWNAICLADMGDTGAALWHCRRCHHVMWLGSRRVNGCIWQRSRLRSTLFARLKKGTSEPIYEKYILKMLGIAKLKLESDQ